jgi:Spy/CpxP family protein refolding chaperone
MVHEELKLSADQERQIEALESAFAERRKSLDAEMRKANAELATAIRASDVAGPEVAAAVHHFHEAMGALQTETIEHVFAMRKILTPEQRARFDDKIAQALTSNAE